MSSADKFLQQPPVIKAEPEDYLDASYKATFSKNDQDPYRITLNHDLTPGNLVQELLEQGKAAYGCEVISPRTFYRELEVMSGKDGSVQELHLCAHDIHLGETILRPIVVSTHQANIEVRKEHGLHKIFNGRSFDILRGTVLADGGYFDVIAAESRLFSLEENSDFPEGTYALHYVREPSFHFRIYLATDLYKNYYSIDENTRKIFLTGVLASALEQIGREFSDGDEIKEELLEEHNGIKQLLESLGDGDYGEALKDINQGEAAKMASTYRNIRMVADD